MIYVLKTKFSTQKINLRDTYNDKIELLGIKTSYKGNWVNIILIYNPCNAMEYKLKNQNTMQIK